ncbi:hypothetical protein [Nisaea sp.]|uniref:glycosyltransferase n=1 Tax=Nisaea sp. TaxID=2024842 RepID=UPI0032EDF2B7
MIAFVLAEGEPVPAEKRRFYQGQIDRLRAEGLEADLYEFSDQSPALPNSGTVAVFDIECRKFLRRHLDERRIPHAPLIWNPYAFFMIGQTWVRTSSLVVETLVPGMAAGQMLQKFALGKPVETITVSANYIGCDDHVGPPLASSGRPLIGCFGAGRLVIDFVKSVLIRRMPELVDCQWVHLDSEMPERWRDDLARCDTLFSFRSLCGSAIPLMDAMASGVVVAGSHGGGLSGIADAENGIWINSATLEIIAEELSAGLSRLEADPAWRRRLIDGASAVAKNNSVDATFPGNLEVWRRLIERAHLVR